MNKRIKKKRKIEKKVALLIAENALQADALRNQHKRIEQLEQIVEHNAQATNNELSRIKKKHKNRWKK
ncbi:TPA: hypothetical protein VAP21_001691 [Streptococcus agalactiae]|uniref:hypothetical protein n=1 Tax=Streptococcus TaxID=1301 RepID=UPI0002B95BEC|nr:MULTISPECIES: hypothetical protein [Streptococcus]EPW99899.1 hypothetical protein SAG0148_01485 [Streptococcus agalactiae MRI Z1-049]QBX18037.1 hypothetical protein Javan39_0025 [Streptococcus phage Javan39]AYY67538.1 hypothetical protein EGX72_00245 [Streptococcus sp. FDAARGOS_521]AYZ05187.1 hypothetical protein EGX96_08430 [Streptococcus sp. FDAARGOS_520]EPV10276.1 hypothetical protein SAG0330_01440 [Streptococcus agalactiae GB00561]